ncbi:MAG: ATP-dependent metallopeptidase FtsH/Yme1/Tma family protein, partial [Allosphingosinicella sp.]
MSDNRTPTPEKDPQGPGNPWMKSLFIWAGILLALILFVQIVGGGDRTAGQSAISYSEFLDKVDEGSVKQVAIGKDVISGKLSNGDSFRTNAIPDPELTRRLRERSVEFTGQSEQQTSIWVYLLMQSLPFLLILGIAFFIMRQMQKNAGSGAMGFGKSKAKLLTEKHGRVTFDDVAGIDEAREELQEIVDFLKDPTKFARLGGKIPKGALLVGSPGTGQT